MGFFIVQEKRQKTILRKNKDRENPYVMIAKDIMQEEGLSFKARGIMAYLLSLPDDWVLHMSELEKRSKKDGRERIASGIKELIEFGYITRIQERSESGKWGTMVYLINEIPNPMEPTTPTANGFPANGLPVNEKTAATNTHTTNTNLTKKINNKKDSTKKDDRKSKYEKFYL